jgi:hypothetical protein
VVAIVLVDAEVTQRRWQMASGQWPVASGQCENAAPLEEAVLTMAVCSTSRTGVETRCNSVQPNATYHDERAEK